MENDVVSERQLGSLINTAKWFYLFHALSMVFTLGALSFIPVILSYLKRPEARGTFVYSHHNWQIASFWIYVGCIACGWVLAFTLIGIPLALLLWGAAWLWKAYRLIVGYMALEDNRPIGVSGDSGIT